jgi:hypothetical protein
VKNYAVVKNNKIINVIVANSEADVADAYSDCLIIEQNKTNGFGAIGGDLFEGKLRMKQPYPSWSWSGSAWEPPTAHPEPKHLFYWNEDSLSWIAIEEVAN